MDKETAIKKIQKCLALSASNEPNEAAAALRQAQKLMAQFGVDQSELLAASISETWSKSSASKTPPRYEVRLASMIASVFGCDLMFTRKLSSSQLAIDGGYSFIGSSAAPEVASYSFVVLRRMLKKARQDYIATALKRHKKNKTIAADMYCDGWVTSVQQSVSSPVMQPNHKAEIEAFVRINYPETNALPVQCRTMKGKGWRHHATGYADGKKVKLNSGISQPKFDLLN